MEKPRLTITMHQETPPLPDPHEFAERIFESIRFIDENPDATAADLTHDMLELWYVDPELLEAIRRYPDRIGEMYLTPSVVSSLIIFGHIYLTYYREEDFADFVNFVEVYFRFQMLLNAITNRKEDIAYSIDSYMELIVFDMENLDSNIDNLTYIISSSL